jgi:hypothetical protein
MQKDWGTSLFFSHSKEAFTSRFLDHGVVMYCMRLSGSLSAALAACDTDMDKAFRVAQRYAKT